MECKVFFLTYNEIAKIFTRLEKNSILLLHWNFLLVGLNFGMGSFSISGMLELFAITFCGVFL